MNYGKYLHINSMATDIVETRIIILKFEVPYECMLYAVLLI